MSLPALRIFKRFLSGSLFFIAAVLAAYGPVRAGSASYSFVTRWVVEAPADQVWDLLYRVGEWPEWWKGVEVSDTRHTDSGVVVCMSWKGRLPYKLYFCIRETGSVRDSMLSGRAWGDLEGTGLWLLSREGGVTTVFYYWDVHTTGKWMNRFSFLLKPVFRANHNLVMKRGSRGLADRLGARLIDN